MRFTPILAVCGNFFRNHFRYRAGKLFSRPHFTAYIHGM